MIERQMRYVPIHGKSHLCRLPNLPEPLPEYPGKSKRAIMVFPIFQRDRFADGNTLELSHLFDFTIRSGVWARRTWQMYSDLVDYDIQMAFYVHEEARSLILPILKDNFVDDKDIYLRSDAEFRDPNNRLWYPLKIAAATDTRFKDYDYVLVTDIDLFIGTPNREKLNFFERLFNLSPGGYGALHVFDHQTSIHDDIWLMKMSECYPTQEEQAMEWFRRARTLLDSEEKMDVFRADTPPHRIGLNGCFHVFPAKHFHRFRPNDIELLNNCARLLQCDEPSVSVFHTQTGFPVYSVIDELGIRKITSLREISDESLTEPYLCHPGHFRYEMEWREDLDVLKQEQLI